MVDVTVLCWVGQLVMGGEWWGGLWSHFVVFGTKFGAIQDFQRGKKSSLGVQQTPLDPPRPPKPCPDPPNPPLTL